MTLRGAVLLSLLTVPLVAAIPGAAQIPALAGAQSRARVRKQAHRLPASLLPKTAALSSTAESAAARVNHPPAQELPELSLKKADGTAVSTGTLHKDAHWLLVYRVESCMPCDRLLNGLSDAESAASGTGERVVVVVAGPQREGLTAVRGKFAGLNNATWLSDAKGAMTEQLKPNGSPVVYGMDGKKIAWRIAGTLGDARRVGDRAEAWFKSEPSKTETGTKEASAGPTPSVQPAVAP